MKKILIFFSTILCACTLGFSQDCDRVFKKTTSTPSYQGSRTQGSITTMFASNGGYAGNTFDITGNIDFYCDGVDVNWMFAGEIINVDMYYKIGTAYGYEGDPSAWTLLGTNSATASGPDLPTFIDLQGNGVQFAANQEMGCAVHVNNYAYLFGALGYTKGTWIFSNNDITELETHHGLGDPVFGSAFYPRCWNGTFYYNTSGVAYPILDVKCNGGDADVEIYDGDSAVVTVEIQARDFLGYPVEIWVATKTPAGAWYTYQGSNWFGGLGHPAYQGGLIDASVTVLDMVLPLGAYEAYVALDLHQNGQVDFPLFDFDIVNFEVVVPPTEYKWDSGTTNNLLCWISGGDIVGMHCFDTIPGGENLTHVGTIFGSVLHYNYAPGNGTPTEFYVWEATSFGDPTNASVLTQGTGVVGNVDTDVHYWDACACTITTPNFYVAYNLHHGPYEYCLSIDNTNPYVNGAAFYTGTNTMYGFDPVNLYANQYPPAESLYGFWTVRAEY